MKIHLIRHGESEGNKNPEVYFTTRDHNVSLTEKGLAQSLAAGKKLDKELSKNNYKKSTIIEAIPSNAKYIETGILPHVNVFVSPYKRTVQTWEQIKKELVNSNRTLVVKQNPLIREQEWKVFNDMADSKAKREERVAFSKFYYRFKQAESTADVYARVQSFLNRLSIERMKGTLSEEIVIVSHEIAIRCIVAILEEKDYDSVDSLHIPNCKIITLDNHYL